MIQSHGNCSSSWLDLIQRWCLAGRPEHSRTQPRAAAFCHNSQTIGVVVHLIEPACCHRTAPCPQQLSTGMTGSRNNPALPQRICTITSHWRRPTTTTQPHTQLPASVESMHQAGPASRPFVLATLRALRLDRSPCLMLSARSPKADKPLVVTALTGPRPPGMTLHLISSAVVACPRPVENTAPRTPLASPNRRLAWPSTSPAPRLAER
jgi:hypothetical protein